MTTHITDFAGADANPIGVPWEDGVGTGGGLRRVNGGVVGFSGASFNLGRLDASVGSFSNDFQRARITLGADSDANVCGPAVLVSGTEAYFFDVFGGISGVAGGAWRKYSGGNVYLADLPALNGALPGDTFELIAERNIPSAGNVTLTAYKNGVLLDTRVETVAVIASGTPGIYSSFGSDNRVDAFIGSDSPAASVTVTGPANVAHGASVVLTITAAGAIAADRTVAIIQGGVTITQTETSGDATTINLTALLERVDPLTSIRRLTTATVRVTRVSDSEYGEYVFNVVNPAQQTAVDLTSIEPIAANRITAVTDLVVGDQVHARGVAAANLPAGLVLQPNATFDEDAVVSFDVRVYDDSTKTLSGWALQTVAAGVAPAITVQPSSQAVADGAAFSFSIVATGDAPLAYQWTDDGANVGTDSPTYAGTASLAMNGSTIRVTVSNAYGSVLSSAVTLTVTGVISPPGPITGLAVTAITATGATVSYNSTPTATSYEYTLDGTNWVNVGLVLSFPLSGLTQFTNYSVAVRAVNSGGTGAQSSSPFKTLDAQPPTSPQDLIETTIGATTATFSFTAATDNAAVTGYSYRVDGGTYVNIGVSFSFSVSGLSAGSAHLVEVVAYDAAGNVSFPAARSFTTSTLSAPITNVDDIRFHVRGLFKRFVNEGESLAVRVYCRAGKYPATPTQIRYRISCANTDECLQDWQTTTPASVVDVLIPAELNRLRSQWHWFEQRSLTVEATNADGSVRISEYRYFVQNVIGVD